MKRIQDVIREAEERLFVGREPELRLMENQLLNTNTDWRALHFYGPAGIGKSSLLRAFIRKTGQHEVFYFDRLGGYPKTEEFLEMVGSMLSAKGYVLKNIPGQNQMVTVTESLNELAIEKKLLILIFDSYEQWTLLDDWLREVWLPMLVPEIRVCSAGQFPLKNSRLHRSGWEELIHNVEVHPLNKQNVKRYASLKGIQDVYIQDEIERFSAGVPLAISLACEVVVNQGPEQLIDSVQTNMTIEPLIEKLLHNMKDEIFQKLLDIACLLWRFDQDLLMAIIEEPISNECFRAFCRLPFISVCDRGWSLHDAVRKWIKLDLMHRAPDKYEFYRKKALKKLRRREIDATGTDKINFAIEKLYLHENNWIQSYLFNAHGEGVSIRPMRLDDVPVVENIYRLWSLNTAPYIADDTQQEKLIHPLLEIVPSAFSTVWYGEMLIGFHSFVPLNEETHHVFQKHPAFANYLNQTKRKEKEFVIWIGGVLPEFERKAMGVQLRHLLYCFASANQIIGISPYIDLTRVVQSMGFEHTPSFDYKTQNGTLHWYAVQLNLRDEDFLTRLDKLLESMTRDPFANIENKTAFIKKVLIHFDSLEQQTDILESFQRILQLPLSPEGKPQASLLRKYLMEAMDEMTAIEPDAEELQRLLQLAYIQKIGSHQVVADRLNLSISTYYRYLKKAVEKLTITLSKRYET